MTAPFAVDAYLVTPYRPFIGTPAKNERILAECEAHPERFTLPLTRADIRATAAWMLMDLDNAIWEVWRGGDIVGIFLLSRIVPRLDALWHFVFFDDALVGKTALLRAFMRRCFDEWAFERLSLEIPENVTTLISFARRKLGFRYEGEDRDMREHNVNAAWAARQGSRREHAHFDGTRWQDVILLRALKSEYAD